MDHGVLERAAHICSTLPESRVYAMGPHHLVLRHKGHFLAVVADHPDAEALCRQLFIALSSARLELVVLGDQARFGAFKSTMRWFTGHPHALLMGGRSKGRALYVEPLTGPVGPVDTEAFEAWLEPMRAVSEQRRQRMARAPAPKLPVTTIVVATWLVLVFVLTAGLQLKLADGAVLLHMGAVSPYAEDTYRMLSAGSLHGGAFHLVCNVVVLWMMGSMQERLLGPGRMVLVFVTGVLGGSMLSHALNDVMSVGASGGVWGLFVAQALLVWRPIPGVPEEARQNARKGILKLLGLNLLISFVPGVDLWGHLGGGLGGGLAFLLSWKLHKNSRGQRAIAVLSVAAFVSASVTAISVGQPWRLLEEPAITLGPQGMELGDLAEDAGVYVWDVMPFEGDLEGFARRSALDEGVVTTDVLDDQPIVRERLQGQVQVERLWMSATLDEGGTYALLVEVVWWEGAPWEDVAERLIGELGAALAPRVVQDEPLVLDVLSDRFGTSYPVDEVRVPATRSQEFVRLELARHDGSVSEVAITNQHHGQGELVLSFEAMDANQGVRMKHFTVHLRERNARTMHLVEVQYTEEFDE